MKLECLFQVAIGVHSADQRAVLSDSAWGKQMFSGLAKLLGKDGPTKHVALELIYKSREQQISRTQVAC